MKKYLPAIVIAILLAAGVGFALTRSDKKTTDNTTSNSTHEAMKKTENKASSSTPNSTNSATSSAISIKNFAFSPAKTTVKLGTKVTWTNNDTAPHTVTIDSGDGPKSENLENGESFSYTFEKVGNFAYHCSIHPSMTATVTVTQ